MTARRLLGVGVDVARIARFEGTFRRFGSRFLKRAFHPAEQEQFAALATRFGSDPVVLQAEQARFLASRWAAKEALVKAAGKRLLFPDIRVVSSVARVQDVEQLGGVGNMTLLQGDVDDPRPGVIVSGASERMLMDSNVCSTKLSLSHDGAYAVAFVALECSDA